MKKIKFNKRYFVRRIIALPFVFGIILIAHNCFVIKRTWHYLLYGGEYVNFEENERDSMAGIFEMLKDIKSNMAERNMSPEEEFEKWYLRNKNKI